MAVVVFVVGRRRCRRRLRRRRTRREGRQGKGSALHVWQVDNIHPSIIHPSIPPHASTSQPRPGRRRPDLWQTRVSYSVSFFLGLQSIFSSAFFNHPPSPFNGRGLRLGTCGAKQEKENRGLTRHPKIELDQITLEVNALSRNPDCSNATTRATAPASLCIHLLDRLSQPCPLAAVA